MRWQSTGPEAFKCDRVWGRKQGRRGGGRGEENADQRVRGGQDGALIICYNIIKEEVLVTERVSTERGKGETGRAGHLVR